MPHWAKLDDPACGVAWMNARAASAEKRGSGICSAAGWPADGDQPGRH